MDRQGDMLLPAGGLAAELARKWWVLLLRGILLILIGILAFINPLTWVIFVGVYMLVDGAASLWAGIANEPPMQSRWPFIVIGILGILAGIVVLWNPVLGGITLTIVIAAWAIVIGVLQIIQAVRLRDEIDNEWWLILTGALGVLFGLLVFFGGGNVTDDSGGMANIGVVAGLLAISTVFGVFSIVAGVFSILLGFKVRDFGTRTGAVI